MANAKSIEIKVGVLILVALGILVGFVLIMGGVSWQPTYTLYVDFDNPGGVQTGAPVKIASIKVGTVKELQFRGGMTNSKTGQREPWVRLKVALEKRLQAAIHDNASFYVTTQGVLGEQFLAIDPGSNDRPTLADGDVIRGLDPPRLDMLLAEGYELLHTSIQAMRANRAELAEAFQGLTDTLKGTSHFLNTNRDRLDRMASNGEQITVDTKELVQAVRARYVDNPQVLRVLDNLDKTTSLVTRDSDALLTDARETLSNTKRISAALGGSEHDAQRLKQTLADVSELAAKAKLATNDVQSIVAHIKKGEGSVGGFVMSEQLYDDVQELARDLKHNPWKLFWKE